MKKTCCLFDDKGLTLVEVLVATFLLAAVLAPLLGMFAVSARGYAGSGQDTVALNLCRERLETCIAAGYNDLEELVDVNRSWQPCPGYAGYEYQLTVTDYDPVLEVKAIVVQVRPVGILKEGVVLATLLARWP